MSENVFWGSKIVNSEHLKTHEKMLKMGVGDRNWVCGLRNECGHWVTHSGVWKQLIETMDTWKCIVEAKNTWKHWEWGNGVGAMCRGSEMNRTHKWVGGL